MESENVRTTSESQATVFTTTNGSFQNQPSAATAAGATSRARKLGISALLLDISNVGNNKKQVCKPREVSRPTALALYLMEILQKDVR